MQMACTCAPMLTEKWAFIGAGVRHVYASSIFEEGTWALNDIFYITVILRCLGSEAILRVAVLPLH